MISILQDPGQGTNYNINAAYGINPVTITGITQSGLRYRLEVLTEDETALYGSMIITPNQYGNGSVDIQHILQTLIKPSPFEVELTSQITDTFNETKPYKLKAYVVDLTDTPIAGEEVTSDTFIVTGGKKDAWTLGYDFPLDNVGNIGAFSDYYITKKASTLTGKPSIPDNTLVKVVDVYPTDYRTLTYYNQFSAYDIYAFDEEGLLLELSELPNTETTAEYPNVFRTIAAGPNNTSVKFNLPIGTSHYYINVGDDWWRFNIKETQCNDFNLYQVSWLNSWGFRDYYTFSKRDDKKRTVTRNNYLQGVADYNFVVLETTKGSRGQTIYSQTIDEEYTIRTDFLDDAESEYLSSLIESPDVRVYIKGQWYQVLPTTNEWILKRYRTDKMFQLEYSFRIANGINSQRG